MNRIYLVKHRFLVLLAVFFAASGFLIVGNVHADSTDTAKGGRLVTFHDRGDTKVVLTNAQTVRDALKSAKISVIDSDNVEPSLDEKLVAKSYTVNIYRSRPVVVIDGAVQSKILTARQSARDIAKAAGLTLHDEDTTTLNQSTDIVADGAGETLTVHRATEFELTLYGKVIKSYSQAKTVGDMLKLKGLKLSSNDTLSLPASTPLVAGLKVAIWRNGVQTATTEEPVKFGSREIKDFDHPLGYKQVQSKGEDGSRSVTYEIVMRNGLEQSRKELQSLVTKKPVDEVVVVGMAPPAGSHQDWMRQAGIAESDFNYAAYIIDHENRSWHPCKVQGGAVDCAYAGTQNLGYGLVQATPGIKMKSAGADWQTNPITQLKWASSYAIGRYGSWQAAYEFKVSKGWW